MTAKNAATKRSAPPKRATKQVKAVLAPVDLDNTADEQLDVAELEKLVTDLETISKRLIKLTARCPSTKKEQEEIKGRKRTNAACPDVLDSGVFEAWGKLKSALNSLDKGKVRVDHHLLELLGDFRIAKLDNGTQFQFLEIESEVFSVAKLKEQAPEIYERFRITSTSQKMSITS